MGVGCGGHLLGSLARASAQKKMTNRFLGSKFATVVDCLRRCPNTIKIRRFEVSKFLKGRFSSRWTSKTSNH
jgi:hypothetical protein